ncbi:MAG: DUF2993 domain-containing protein [Oculatellaceae cyanobacterium bins.114]|nr:DUF2993 domain-containing protein [Oculatellaceae cyanobacterium bins.114]
MEFITILLSSLIGIITPAGFVLDRVAEDAIRDRLYDAEEVQVRIDNTPSYQIAQGQVDQVRIALRGVFPVEGMRIDTFEVETDPISIDPGQLRGGEPALEKPLQAGVRLVLNRDDLNQALRSPRIVEQLRNLSLDAVGGSEAELRRYDIVNPQIDFLQGERVRFQATLRQQQTHQELRLLVESGLEVVGGRRLQLTNLVIQVNDEANPSQLTQRLAAGLNRRLDLQRLEADGVFVRVLQFEMEPDELAITPEGGVLHIAAFVRIDPNSPLLRE